VGLGGTIVQVQDWQQYMEAYPSAFDSDKQMLVIDDDLRRAEILCSSLGTINAFAVRALTALQAVPEQITSVDLVLVSLDAPYSDRLAAASRLVSIHPNALLIGYGMQEGDLGACSAFRLAGGWEPLPYPFDPAAFAQAIRSTRLRALKYGTGFSPVALHQDDATIVRLAAVYSPKGGVGTTTLAVNLAAAATKHITPVALVDGDLEFSTHEVFLNLKPTQSILQCLEDTASAITTAAVEETMTLHPSGIHALLAPPHPELVDLVYIAHLRRVLTLLRAHYRLTIVDAGSGNDERTWSMLEMADVILVPFTPEMPGVKVFESFLQLAQQHGISPARLTPILMRATSVPPAAIQSIESRLHLSLVWRIRSDGRRVLASINDGTPFVLGSPQSPLSEEVQILASSLLAENARLLLHAGPDHGARGHQQHAAGA